ncbi:MAG: acyltransferase [Ferruginibacter sp.]
MIAPGMQQSRFRELDVLRGIAALFVVFFHLTMNEPQYKHIFKLGVTGVELFFMISGFVIFMSLQKISSSAAFVINRISRLYPTYWTAVTFSLLLHLLFQYLTHNLALKSLFIKYIGNMTMFQFYMKIYNLESPYWTLIIEMLFYILILILFHFKLLKWVKHIFFVLSLTTVISIAFAFDNFWVKTIISQIPLFQFIPLFFAGILFYKIYSGEKRKNSWNYLLVIFCLVSQQLLFQYAGGSRRFISWTEYNLILTFYFILFTIIINLDANFIINRFTLFFGKISFALYLTHKYVSLKYIIPLFHLKLGMNFWMVVFLIDIPIVIGIASFITYKIEIPYSKKMKDALQKIFLFKQKTGSIITGTTA